MLDGWSYVSIVGTLIGPFGLPSEGVIQFTPSTRVKSPDGTYYVLPQTLGYRIGSDGTIDVSLLANDTPGTDPSVWNWKITERIQGTITRSFYTFLPKAHSVVNYADLYTRYYVEGP